MPSASDSAYPRLKALMQRSTRFLTRILALPKLSPEERREIRAKLNELDGHEWLDEGELTEQEKAIIEARLEEYENNPEAGSSWEEAKARIIARLHGK